ncbi:hypothetical protein HNQ77_004523 [Silvibacterium bohemicum]|uniref:Uncharacterized protein n=1 Tax=Silvibacterium bohemicum TaxID=1577686 RepID=A0A841K8B9_9BACT|nr:hypothetical protein [Silvibacterium bohemicum]MBB6146544.1 hypothetical protein [Silvibacterium bohemicum]
MRGFTFLQGFRSGGFRSCGFRSGPASSTLLRSAVAFLLAAPFSLASQAQVFTVTPEGIDGKYLDFHPTDIPLPEAPLTNHNREDLLRFLQAEQGFAMRPLPIGVLTLHANGAMQPSGSDYANAIRNRGLSVKAGERVTVTDIRIEKDRLQLDFNGGPEHKHKFLRHVSVGMDPNATTPVVHDDPQAPSGSRIVLIFPHAMPDVTGLQVEALVKPIVDFSVKSPQQAFTDTLPPALRKTILEHHVLVGMNEQMVVSALGSPKNKVRENDGQTPFEEWIYGDPPQPVQFVRFNGNRVIRVEIANVGESPVIRTQNEMGDYWSTAPGDNTRIVKLGDQNPADTQAQNAPHAPPTLRNPGEKLPGDDDKDKPVMKPVQFPKDSQDGQKTAGSGQNPNPNPATIPASSSATPQPASAPAPTPSLHPTMPSPDEQLRPTS